MSEETPNYGNEPTYIVEPPKSCPKVKIKKLHPDAVIPTKATPQSACYDVYAPCNFEVRPGRSVMPLGLAIELPIGYAAEIRARSGYSSKGFAGNFDVSEYRFDADTIAGIVDADFRQGIGVILKSCETRPFTILKGQRVAQMLIIKAETVDFEESDSLSETERHGGFGHTGI